MKSKYIILILIFLLFNNLIIVSCANNLSNNFITVDDNGEADFHRIQDAIDYSSDGDTIYVFDGIYLENLVINKKISLISGNKYSTFILGNGSKNVILVIRSDVKIINFTIQKNGLLFNGNNANGIFLNNVKNCSIENNILNNTFNGIIINSSNNNSIKNNTLSNNSISGIYLYSSNNQKLLSNYVINCSNGFYLEESKNNSIKYNSIIENERGVFCSYSPNNNLEFNNFISNEENAKFTKFFNKDFTKPNKWRYNFWDNWIGFGIKIIPGIMYIPNNNIIGGFIPWIEVDLHPNKTPNIT